MTELKWIILTHSYSDKDVRIARDKIVAYYSNPAPRKMDGVVSIGTVVETVRGSHEVKESPSDIDNLLGLIRG